MCSTGRNYPQTTFFYEAKDERGGCDALTLTQIHTHTLIDTDTDIQRDNRRRCGCLVWRAFFVCIAAKKAQQLQFRRVQEEVGNADTYNNNNTNVDTPRPNNEMWICFWLVVAIRNYINNPWIKYHLFTEWKIKCNKNPWIQSQRFFGQLFAEKAILSVGGFNYLYRYGCVGTDSRGIVCVCVADRVLIEFRVTNTPEVPSTGSPTSIFC